MIADAAGIADERARHVAAAICTAATDVLSWFAQGYVGGADPNLRSSWSDERLFKAYVELAGALADGRRHGLHEHRFFIAECQGCRNFTALTRARADLPPVPVEGAIETGVCAAHTPTRVMVPGRLDDPSPSVWPTVHRHQWCGEFSPITNRRMSR